MKKNMGTIDVIIRLVIAALLIILYFTHVISGILGIVLLIIAAIFILTSIFNICPLYLLFGISTRPKKQ
jgi:uncharacterized membrane protein